MEATEDSIVRAGLLVVGARALTDLDGAIAMLRPAIPALADPRPALRLLAAALQTRFELTGSVADLEACNESLAALLEIPGEPRRQRTHTEAWLGLNLARRHLATGDPRDRDRAVQLLARILEDASTLPPDTAARVAHSLGRLLLARSAGRPGPDLDESAAFLRRATAFAPYSPAPQRDLCEALTRQWRHGSRPALNALIASRRALTPLLAGSAQKANDEALGTSLAERHLLSGSPDDRAEAVAFLVAPARRRPTTALLLARVLVAPPAQDDGDLAYAQRLLSWLARSPALSGDDQGIALSLLKETGLRRAKHPQADLLLAQDERGQAERTALMALADAHRARLLGNHVSAQTIREAIPLLPPGHPQTNALTVELALAVVGGGLDRTEARPEDVAAAMLVLTESLNRDESSREMWVECAERLVLALYRLFRARWAGTVGDEVFTATARDVDEWSGADQGAIVEGLGLLLCGAADGDTGRAVDRLEQGLAGLAEGHRLRSAALVVLGLVLSRRSGSDAEAERADRYLDEAARLAPEAEGIRTVRAAHQVKTAWRRGSTDLVERAIAALESVVSSLSSLDPWFPLTLRALGHAWYLRGVLIGTDDDLSRGCRLLISAWESASMSHPDRDRLGRVAAKAAAALAAHRWSTSLPPLLP